ncbi:MAG: hypothetical protein IJP31_01170 [Lachnospiraceae bacterium]|nr:hypothetical protein [Lachnospiraceae bacterium]
MGEYRLEQEGIRVETKLPLQTLLSMEIREGVNSHSCLELEAIVAEERKQDILVQNWQGETVLATLDGDRKECLFFGRLERLTIMEEKNRMFIRLTATAETALLDKKKKSRSFQNPNMTYQQILKKIVKEYSSVDGNWNKAEEKIQEPIIQYEETDWSFLRRLSSHFHTGIVGRGSSKGTMLFLAAERGSERQVRESEILGWGVSEAYFRNGCYEKGMAFGDSAYLAVKTKENWNLGDHTVFEGTSYQLYERQIIFRQGELQFIYQLGRPGLLYQKKAFNPHLDGVSLEGTVKRVEEEKVYIQLDMDQEPGAEYPWKWAPQTNHFSYCMPETNTKVSLYFSTSRETSGQAVLGKFNRDRNRYRCPQNREFITLYQKKLGLYPKKLFLEGKDRAVCLTMEDASGIRVNSQKGISLSASGRIEVKGKQLSAVSPTELVCRTPVSNIELCRDINLFAPSGVQTIGTEDGMKALKEGGASRRSHEQQDQAEGWQAAYTAMAAIPVMDFSSAQEAGYAIDVVAGAGIPRIAGGQAVHAMMEVMNGKKERESSFPQVFKSMDNYTVKGGYLLPEREVVNDRKN